MAIDFRKYVDIISGVGGGAAVKVRDLITRIFTTSQYVDPASVLEFTSAQDVGRFFGTASAEFRRAVFYFGWISPLIGSTDKLSFARIVLNAAGSAIFGGGDAKALATFTAVNAGKILFVIDGVQHEVTGFDLSAAGSLAAVATAIQAKIVADGNPAFAGATVAYDATRNSFVLQLAPAVDTNSITVIADTPPDLGSLLEWTQGTGAVFTAKAVVKSAVDTFNDSVNLSNNFGTFVMPDVDELPDVLALAQVNQTYNVMFQYLVSVTAENAAAWSAALFDVAGVALTRESPATVSAPEYPEMIPGIILAATDYEKRNAVMSPMYKQFDVTPSVVDTVTSNTLDALRVNYYGLTQNAGQQIAFYQRGLLMGQGTAPVDQNIYGNEQWMKSDIASNILGGQLSLGQLSADVTGRSQVLSIVQETVDKALNNGVIAIGKPFTTVQKLFITQETGDELAWYQVQGIGYWLDAEVTSSETEDGRTEWSIDYTLIYSKRDAVRTVNGTHVLI